MYKLLVMSTEAVLLAGTARAQAPRTILVQGVAERELDPERLDVLLPYRFSDNVKESERTQAQEEALRRVLGRAGIAEDKLMLEELTASGYGGKVGNSTVALTKTCRLQLDNPRQLNTLVPQLVQTGANNLRFVNLRSRREAATRAELTTQATANARQKAELAVKGAGGQLGACCRCRSTACGALFSSDAGRSLQAGVQQRPAARRCRARNKHAHLT